MVCYIELLQTLSPPSLMLCGLKIVWMLCILILGCFIHLKNPCQLEQLQQTQINNFYQKGGRFSMIHFQ